jgi:hypothetical protein
VIRQLKLTVILPAKPCREDGSALSPNAMPPEKSWNVNWSPFEDELQFCIADFLYRREEMSQGNINTLLNLWGLSLMKHGATLALSTITNTFSIQSTTSSRGMHLGSV